MVDARMADRVVELERALSLAREEQNALREALEESRQHRHERHSQISVDAPGAATATADEQRRADKDVDRWSDTRSSPESLETLTPSAHAPSSHSHDEILRQNHDLRYKLANLQDQIPTHTDTEWNDLRSRLHTTEKESQERLHQLLSLKSSISSLTRSDAQATDSELADAFNQLANRIREWVLSNFRRTKLDIADLPPGTIATLRSLTPSYESIERTDRLALYQALVSNALMQIFDEPVVLGLPDTGLRAFATNMQDDGVEYREWRRATIRVLEAREGTGSALGPGRNEALHRIAREIAQLLFTLTGVEVTQSAQAALMGVLRTAADLQRMLALQKARYQVRFFRDADTGGRLNFDERRMESVNDLDNMVDDGEVGSLNRRFIFCVFPCLEKFGDERGENTQVSNVLLKARVCCGVG
jgi:hypothetical protein